MGIFWVAMVVMLAMGYGFWRKFEQSNKAKVSFALCLIGMFGTNCLTAIWVQESLKGTQTPVLVGAMVAGMYLLVVVLSSLAAPELARRVSSLSKKLSEESLFQTENGETELPNAEATKGTLVCSGSSFAASAAIVPILMSGVGGLVLLVLAVQVSLAVGLFLGLPVSNLQRSELGAMFGLGVFYLFIGVPFVTLWTTLMAMVGVKNYNQAKGEDSYDLCEERFWFQGKGGLLEHNHSFDAKCIEIFLKGPGVRIKLKSGLELELLTRGRLEQHTELKRVLKSFFLKVKKPTQERPGPALPPPPGWLARKTPQGEKVFQSLPLLTQLAPWFGTIALSAVSAALVAPYSQVLGWFMVAFLMVCVLKMVSLALQWYFPAQYIKVGSFGLELVRQRRMMFLYRESHTFSQGNLELRGQTLYAKVASGEYELAQGSAADLSKLRDYLSKSSAWAAPQ